MSDIATCFYWSLCTPYSPRHRKASRVHQICDDRQTRKHHRGAGFHCPSNLYYRVVCLSTFRLGLLPSSL